MKQADELTTTEAARLLGYKDRKSVIQLWRAGRIGGREERVGVFGYIRIYVSRADVQHLADGGGINDGPGT